jgi:hypothetical protein
LQTVRSGHKEGELFIFNCGELNPGELPLFLRRQQMFAKDSMSKLVQFVASAVPNEPTLKDFVHVSLHCYRPENNEDKVYLVTVHPGHSAGMFHVTAHWGARSAKRLSSQLKAINVTKEAANAEVVKAKQEKVKGGYLPAPLSKVLSDEAWSHLAASMGVIASEPSKAKPPVKDKASTKVKTPVVSPDKAPETKSIKASTKVVTVAPEKSPTKVVAKTKSSEAKLETGTQPTKASPKKPSKTEEKLPAKVLAKKAAKSAK